MKAVNALYEAHKIAFSPFVFETAYTMLELGVLESIHNHRTGISIEDVAKETGVSDYGVRVLVEMAEAAGILEKNENDLYITTKIGYFLLRDEMTKVNLYFTHDVCYEGLFFLKESIQNWKARRIKSLWRLGKLYMKAYLNCQIK